MQTTLTYIGGPTMLSEIAGLRLLTDPTFDPGGSSYETPAYTLEKVQDPAVAASALGSLDAVLLSHDHHFDNLDRAGRALVSTAPCVLTTMIAAERLGSNATGLTAWDVVKLPSPLGGALTITATPARHGPPGGDRGPCIGFVLEWSKEPQYAVYVSGDTVWFDGVEQVLASYPIRLAILFLGAARVAVAGPSHLTFTAEEGVRVARAAPRATIVPVHFEGWRHFTEGRKEIERAFASADLEGQLYWLEAGQPTPIND